MVNPHAPYDGTGTPSPPGRADSQAVDDHVHVLVQPLGDFALGEILHSWKSYIGSPLQKGRGRKGGVWQDEYFDRIVRPQARDACATGRKS